VRPLDCSAASARTSALVTLDPGHVERAIPGSSFTTALHLMGMRTRGPPPVLTAASVSFLVRVVMDLAITVNRAPRWLVLVTTLGYSHEPRFRPSAWNGSWNDAPNNPSAVGAFSAMTCAIGAASALGARGRTSCKRQVIESDPDGSQQAQLAFFVVA
jgi:hypothetical protein